ncbi:phosphoesterase [Anaerovibrio sp. JC8]|uniref:metallophosphoesterase n=1 Tax=Anaerovibrio sp. JC8 TaxID=1240085 RepID=UPI000A0D3241|nr:metallophosphoesterase [Anaerovibrio sp. JC8]ORU00804.1 phosphoesterase [Anaerovibrio sp. JC8]
MRVGVMSDSHGNTMAVDQAIEKAGEVDCWLHAGDLVEDAEYLGMVTDKPVINVAGNCDWPGSGADDEVIAELGGHKILLTHGHIYGVKRSTLALRQAAVNQGADIAVYGHTHVAEIDEGPDCLVLNPGSVSHPRDGKPQSFMVLNINGDQVKVEHIHI